jgi:L-serine dehydratase
MYTVWRSVLTKAVFTGYYFSKGDFFFIPVTNHTLLKQATARIKNMDISIFEIIGPVMIGPSSSGTAGMARIGSTANKFLTAPLKSINITVTPRFEQGYIACRSHLGLIGGAMGIPEYDSRLRDALKIAKEQGIELSYSIFKDPVPDHALTVMLTMEMVTGEVCTVTGTSLGGGIIGISNVDGFPIQPSTTEAHVFVWSDRNIADSLQQLLPQGTVHVSEKGNSFLYYVSVKQKPEEAALEAIRGLNSVKKVIFTPAFISLGSVPHEPLFTTYEQLVKLSEETGKDVFELTMEYEINRSGRSRQEIWDQMAFNLQIMKQAAYSGLHDEIHPLYGFNKGDGGKRLYKATMEGKTMGGSTLGRAIAMAIGTMEHSMSLNCVVAAPTGGSCGIVPGCFLVAQEDKGFSDEELIKALFVAAAAGVVVYYHGSTFSGSQGGCQVEVGVSSAMAAAGMVYLAGGDAYRITQGIALAMKNILGLICDPLKTCDEIPCIKRNGIGVGNAFSGADMAIAGIDSYIPPDEVIDCLVDVQKKMPVELRGSGCGARGSKTGLASVQIALDMCKDVLLPLKK